MQPDSESVYCHYSRSVHVSEKGVGRAVVGGVAERIAGQPVAEEGIGLGLGVVVSGL